MNLPHISIVTPSFNQAAFLEDAIESVLGQRFDALEYVIMDGGSTDGSAAIIERHAARLAFWTSAPDDGHYA
ncbi:MAG TPA: glycosyltransferase, partial [Chthoniobacteraceae bacterium]|nr:glycosyltransferase [Chthoniobacteraceae bacterium]